MLRVFSWLLASWLKSKRTNILNILQKQQVPLRGSKNIQENVTKVSFPARHGTVRPRQTHPILKNGQKRGRNCQSTRLVLKIGHFCGPDNSFTQLVLNNEQLRVRNHPPRPNKVVMPDLSPTVMPDLIGHLSCERCNSPPGASALLRHDGFQLFA